MVYSDSTCSKESLQGWYHTHQLLAAAAPANCAWQKDCSRGTILADTFGILQRHNACERNTRVRTHHCAVFPNHNLQWRRWVPQLLTGK